MRYIFLIVPCIAFAATMFTSCSGPEELTPKTKSYSENQYLLPTGTILSSQEREEVQQAWDEYNSAINQ